VAAPEALMAGPVPAEALKTYTRRRQFANILTLFDILENSGPEELLIPKLPHSGPTKEMEPNRQEHVSERWKSVHSLTRIIPY